MSCGWWTPLKKNYRRLSHLKKEGAYAAEVERISLLPRWVLRQEINLQKGGSGMGCDRFKIGDLSAGGRKASCQSTLIQYRRQAGNCGGQRGVPAETQDNLIGWVVEMSEEKLARNKPVFSLSEDAIKQLAGDSGITASEICALLTVACFTDATGIYSTAGAKAIRNALAIGTPKAEGLLRNLSHKGFIHDPKGMGNSKLKKEMPIREGRAMVRWIIKPGKSRAIWFSSSLVRGYGRWVKPLQTLRGCGDLSARLLLALYTFEDAITYGGISPMSVRHHYTTEMMESSLDGEYSLHHAEQDQLIVCSRLYAENLRLRSKENGGSLEPFWDALNQLEKRGFIYECLTVFTGLEVDEDMCLLYPLHTYNRHGHAPKGEESLATEMHKIASLYGYPTADECGRFYGRFAFISYKSQPVQAVGIYRLRFRNTSPAFEEVYESWLNIKGCREHWNNTANEVLEGE